MAHTSTPELLALHGLRLLGTAEPTQVADYFGVSVGGIRDALSRAEADGLVERHEGRFAGFRLTDAGRERGAAVVADEVATISAEGRIAELYASFGELNTRLLEVCTRWQLKGHGVEAEVNHHDDAAYDAAVIAELGEVHAGASPVVEGLADLLDRFAGHARRLRFALDRVRQGDHDYLTKPMFPSYHSVWFELHEDLLATLGRTRSDEGSN